MADTQGELPRIMADFNSLNSTPLDRLKLGHEGTPNGDALPPLRRGQRVLFYDEEMEIEGTVDYVMLRGRRYWLGIPDWSTQRDIAAGPADATHHSAAGT
jgi:hypothetical protein